MNRKNTSVIHGISQVGERVYDDYKKERMHRLIQQAGSHRGVKWKSGTKIDSASAGRGQSSKSGRSATESSESKSNGFSFDRNMQDQRQWS